MTRIGTKRGMKTVPDEYPEQKKAIEVGKKRWEKMKDDIGPGRSFETEGAKSDYMKRVASNRNNVLGIPAFLEAEHLSMSTAGLKEARECECGGCAIYADHYICPRCGKDNS